MSYLIDTNVISELVAKRRNPAVIEWLTNTDRDSLFISVLTIAELRFGIDRLPPSQRKKSLSAWLDDGVITQFGRNILPINTAIALRFGSLKAQLEQAGNPLPVTDSLIAATALAHDLIIVTRNSADFIPTNVRLFNPWES